MGMEQEIKLRAADSNVLEQLLNDPLLQTLRVGPVESVQMQTTYFDTEDHLMARYKWALRSRMENGEPVITLKTPPDENRIRGEWELRGTGLLENGEILPSAFQALFVQGAPQRILDLQECGLETLCRVDFLRRRVSLCLEGGAVAELALDLGTLYRGHRSAPLCEIELEGKGGSFAPVEALAQELMRRYPLQEEPLSKFQQTMQL